MDKCFDLIKAPDQAFVERALIAAQKAGKWEDNYISKISCILVSFYKWLLSERHIDYNPYPFSRFKRPTLKEPEFLSPDEFDLIVSNPLLTLQEITMLYLFWDTGIRRLEAVSLDISDVYFEDKLIKIGDFNSKGGYSGRWIPFGDKSAWFLNQHIKWLKKHSNNNCLFINSEWNRLDDNSVSDMFKKIGLLKTPSKRPQRLHPHLLRHSLGSRLLDKNAPQFYVMRLLGHKSPTMTNHYVHWNKDQLKVNADKYAVFA